MGSGKSFVTDKICRKFSNYTKTSFATRVKELATELFGMTYKDRGLLINFATKMREIDPNVWINSVMRFVENISTDEFVIIDDLRLMNEYETLRSKKWFLIKMDVDEDIRQNRLQTVYGDKYDSHKTHFKSVTENDVVTFDSSCFDYVIQNDSDIERLLEIIEISFQARSGVDI